MGTRSYRVSRNINAPAASVWALIANADGYTDWNDAVVSIKGPIREGGTIKLVSTVSPKRCFKLRVTQMRNHLSWRGAALCHWDCSEANEPFPSSTTAPDAASSQWSKSSPDPSPDSSPKPSPTSTTRSAPSPTASRTPPNQATGSEHYYLLRSPPRHMAIPHTNALRTTLLTCGSTFTTRMGVDRLSYRAVGCRDEGR